MKTLSRLICMAIGCLLAACATPTSLSEKEVSIKVVVGETIFDGLAVERGPFIQSVRVLATIEEPAEFRGQQLSIWRLSDKENTRASLFSKGRHLIFSVKRKLLLAHEGITEGDMRGIEKEGGDESSPKGSK